MVLDHTNNESYAYLKSIGSTWKYNPDNVHPKLVARLYRRFDTFDLNSDDVMKMEEVLVWPERMDKLMNAKPEELEKMRGAIRKMFGACGVTAEGLKRKDWVEANQVFGEAERERIARGEDSLVTHLGNSYFDVIDIDDNHNIGVEELKTMMRAFEVPEEAAYTFFKQADVNLDGKLKREEGHELFRKFWLYPYDSKYDGIYAHKY